MAQNQVSSPMGLAFFDIVVASLHLYLKDFNLAKKLYLKAFSASQGQEVELEMLCLEGLSAVLAHENNVYLFLNGAIIYLAFARKTKKLQGTCQSLQYLGDAFLQQGDTLSALSLFRTALDEFTFMDIHRGRGDCMMRIGDILNILGQVAKANEMWKAARVLFVRSSRAQDIKQCDKCLGVLSELEVAIGGDGN